MSVQWPAVQSRLVALLPTLSGWSGVPVYDGAPDSAEQTDSYCAVGYVEGEQGAGSVSLAPDSSGFFDIETGEVRCELFSGNGDGDLAAARAAGFALLSSLRSYIQQNRTLGVLPAGSSSQLAFSVVTGKQSGAGLLLVLSVTYTAPIT